MESVLIHDVDVAKRSSGRIKIEGNCDEFGTDEYNYALGLKRAKVVKESLASQGVEYSRMVLISYGESSPVCTNMSDECYQRNRRVDLRLVR
jgi:peptidoglycan-associated lipoprotein